MNTNINTDHKFISYHKVHKKEKLSYPKWSHLINGLRNQSRQKQASKGILTKEWKQINNWVKEYFRWQMASYDKSLKSKGENEILMMQWNATGNAKQKVKVKIQFCSIYIRFYRLPSRTISSEFSCSRISKVNILVVFLLILKLLHCSVTYLHSSNIVFNFLFVFF